MSRAARGSGDPLEVELKFHLPLGSHALLEAGATFAAVKPRQLHQLTTYFDSDNDMLDAAGLSLRVRDCDALRTQTVKSRPAGLGLASTRTEWAWPIDGQEPELERLAATPELAKLAAQLRGALHPVYLTDIRRTVRLLHLGEDTIVEAALDSGSIVVGRRREPVSELELEWKGGALAPMYRLAAHLLAVAPFWILAESKSARGRCLRNGKVEGASGAEAVILGRRGSAAQGFRQIIGAALGHVMANIAPFLRGEPEGVHELRTALRAIRAGLRLFAAELDADTVLRLDVALRGFGRIFGLARDWDVFCLQTLPAARAALPGLEDLDLAAAAARADAHAAGVELLRGSAFTAVLLELAAWTEAGATRSSTPLLPPASGLADDGMAQRLSALAPQLLDRAAARAKRRGRHARRLSETELHRFRKALDRLCDDVRSLASLYPRKALTRYRERCEALQAVLGEANDAVVTRQLALRLVAAARPELSPSVAVLARWSHDRRCQILRRLEPVLTRFRATPAFWT